MLLLILAEHLQILSPIRVVLEYIAAPISTLRDMVSKPWNDYPRQSCHDCYILENPRHVKLLTSSLSLIYPYLPFFTFFTLAAASCRTPKKREGSATFALPSVFGRMKNLTPSTSP